MRMKALLLVALFAVSASAQNNFHYPRSEAGRVSVTKGAEFRPGLAYDVYRPAGDAIVPVVIIANIGSSAYRGWAIYQGWGDAVANAGMAAIVYDAAPGTALTDFDALLSALRTRSGELRIDTSRIVVWSASANVQIGLPLAMDRSRDYIRGAVIYYGTGEAGEIRTDLPVLYVRAGLDTPHLNADIDKLIARAFAANAPWSIESYGSGLHGFESLNDNAITRATIDRTLAFMKHVTRPEMAVAYAAGADDASAGAAFSRGEWPVAIAAYRKRVSANPADAESHRRLGIALSGAKQPSEALPHLEKAYELGRRGARDTAVPAFEAAAAAGNRERATFWLERILGAPFIPFAEIRAKATTPELQRIVADFEGLHEGTSAVGLKTLSEPALNGVGYRLLRGNKTAEAVKVFRAATERFPKSANAWESLSEAYEQAGDEEGALRASRKALDVLAADTTLSADAREIVRRAAAQRVERLAKKG